MVLFTVSKLGHSVGCRLQSNQGFLQSNCWQFWISVPSESHATFHLHSGKRWLKKMSNYDYAAPFASICPKWSNQKIQKYCWLNFRSLEIQDVPEGERPENLVWTHTIVLLSLWVKHVWRISYLSKTPEVTVHTDTHKEKHDEEKS